MISYMSPWSEAKLVNYNILGCSLSTNIYKLNERLWQHAQPKSTGYWGSCTPLNNTLFTASWHHRYNEVSKYILSFFVAKLSYNFRRPYCIFSFRTVTKWDWLPCWLSWIQVIPNNVIFLIYISHSYCNSFLKTVTLALASSNLAMITFFELLIP